MRSKSIRQFVVLFLLILFFNNKSFAQKPHTFKLAGHIKGLPDAEVYLAFGSFEKMKADTVQAQNGYFLFQDTIPEECYGMLFTHDYSLRIDMFLDKGMITVNGNMDSIYNISVSGSPVVNEYAAYVQAITNSKEPVQSFYEQWINAYNAGDSELVRKYRPLFFDARDKQQNIERKMQLSFIKDHPNSIASAWELLHYVNDKTLDSSMSMYGMFSERVLNSAMGQETGKRIAILNRTKIGNQAPGFEQPGINGKPVSLKSYEGKYVLLEFWASWCGPCRAESPNVLKAYQKYKAKGFDVLSVSLDNDKNKWLDAIDKDGLLWTQVSDLKGWKNDAAALYGISAVPANLLIDPAGKIIARNLRGDDLNNALEKNNLSVMKQKN